MPSSSESPGLLRTGETHGIPKKRVFCERALNMGKGTWSWGRQGNIEGHGEEDSSLSASERN